MNAPPEPAKPSFPDPLWVLGWVAAWLVPFGVWQLLLIPGGLGMYGRSWPSGLFFLAATGAGLLIYRRELPEPKVRPGVVPVLALVAVAVLVAGGCQVAHAAYPVGEETLAAYRAVEVGIVRLDWVYFVVKVPELIFQQSLIYVLVRHLLGRGFSGWSLLGGFGVVFGGIHLPLIVFKGWAGVPFVLAAAGASLVFPTLIARFRAGVAYSFCVHLLAYLVAGLVMRASA